MRRSKNCKLYMILNLFNDMDKIVVCGEDNKVFFCGENKEYRKSVWKRILPDYEVLKISTENGFIIILIDA